MSEKELRKEIINRLKEAKKTVSEVVVEIGEDEEAIRDTILALTSVGELSQEGDRYFVSDEGTASQHDLSKLEWRVVRFLQSRSGKQAQIEDVAKELGTKAAQAAVSKLVSAGILVEQGGWYRITAASALRIPLDADEREALQAAESRIDELVGEVYGRQIEVARQLMLIRGRKLYRETHQRFGDYVAERFERTRDWAYKMIRDLEVAEALMEEKAAPGVEALLQTVSAREMPHLAKLKKDPAKMREALQNAEEKAKSENRARTSDDVKDAVEEIKSPEPETSKEPTPPEPTRTRTVKFTGIKHDPVETDDVPRTLTEFAKWLRKNPTDNAFKIHVGKVV